MVRAVRSQIVMENTMKDTHLEVGQVSVDEIVYSEIEKVYVECRPEDALIPPGAMRGSFEGSFDSRIAVLESEAEYDALASAGNAEILELPADVKSRREILAKWAKKAAKKNKAGLIPVMLLPLAACNTSTTEVTQSYNITEDTSSPGTWVVTPADAGAITITQAGGDYTFTPNDWRRN